MSGAVVALRADFNVPLEDGRVADAARIERTIPTIDYLVAAGAKVVVLSHLGRPGGQARASLTLAPVACFLDDLVAAPVGFLPHCTGPEVSEGVAAMTPGEVLLLENSRFLPGETANDPDLAAEWASWADHFVMDAFGTVHRAHASTEGLPRAVRAKGGEAVGGRLVELELAVLGSLLDAPRRPFVAILGGSEDFGENRRHRSTSAAGGWLACGWSDGQHVPFGDGGWRQGCHLSNPIGPRSPSASWKLPPTGWCCRWTA